MKFGYRIKMANLVWMDKKKKETAARTFLSATMNQAKLLVSFCCNSMRMKTAYDPKSLCLNIRKFRPKIMSALK